LNPRTLNPNRYNVNKTWLDLRQELDLSMNMKQSPPVATGNIRKETIKTRELFIHESFIRNHVL